MQIKLFRTANALNQFTASPLKKISLLLICLIICSKLFSQENSKTQQPPKTNWCATKIPDAAWTEAFNAEVEKYKSNLKTNGTQSLTTYTIPVIVHIIHGGQAEGTWPNISQAQIVSQIAVLNQDYSNQGAGVSQYNAYTHNGHGPFYDYAQANSLPAPNNTTGGVVACNTGIQFCMALTDTNGNPLAEPGIDRVNYSTKGFSNPTSSSSSNFDSYLDNTLKPAVIWNNTKYMNLYVSDRPSSSTLLGYTTFPASSTLTGITTGIGTTTNDGIWIYGKAFGTTGTLISGYTGGQVCGHESGHYFGLRHPWGDGTCLSDYCNDTPPSYEANYNSNSTIVYPYTDPNGSCTGNVDVGDGEMYMNLMDYSEDAAKYMFTNDQVTRMQTAMQNSPYRKNLSGSTLCTANTTNISSNTLQNNMVLYPNPSNGSIQFITTFLVSTNLHFTVTNMLGELVTEKTETNITNNIINFNLSQQPKGVYFITIVSSQNEKAIKKIIIE